MYFTDEVKLCSPRKLVVNGEIIATQLQPPIDPEVWMPFKRKDLFKISVDSEGKTVVNCLQGSGGPHKIEIMKGNSSNQLSVQCKQPEKHSKSKNREEKFASWIRDEVGIPLEHGVQGYQMTLLKIKYLSIQHYESSCSFTCLQPINSLSNVPIQSGLFKGTYGGHGVEVIQLTYEGNRLYGTKVSGDPNVPAGKRSIIVHLDEPLVLNREQQRDLNSIKQLQNEDCSLPEGQEAPARQPFSIPFGIEDRGFLQLCEQKDIPTDFCRARYFGTGLIAMHGFRNSSRTDCHLVIFDEDVFAFLWMELGSLSVYSRADEFL
ncbi:F-box only protein 31-like [Apostichopus japonicus]|uniref:F-box only protein 31-like n=1 Tax=Stichopus japonicus TaxID=307972 RepID=UPI003AB569E7